MFKRTLLLASCIAPTLTLGACGTSNRGLESVHQPVVSRNDYAFDASTDGGHLSRAEADRLAGWMSSLKLTYGDRVSIDDPANSGVRTDVAAQVARYGLLVSDDAPITGAPVAPGTVRIVVSRMVATVPHCPDYSRMGQPEFNSNTSSNQGCAINSNLAMMVARPEDLVHGRSGSEVTDPAQSNKAIDTYRKAPSTGAGGLKTESTGGK